MAKGKSPKPPLFQHQHSLSEKHTLNISPVKVTIFTLSSSEDTFHFYPTLSECLYSVSVSLFSYISLFFLPLFLVNHNLKVR